MNYTIKLADCAFYARHGVLDAEKALGQRFYVDAVLVVRDMGALESDEIEGTVHYGEAFEAMARVVTGTRRRLIETLAHDVCLALLARFESLEVVEITVRKPSVPIEGILDHAAATVRVERSP